MAIEIGPTRKLEKLYADDIKLLGARECRGKIPSTYPKESLELSKWVAVALMKCAYRFRVRRTFCVAGFATLLEKKTRKHTGIYVDLICAGVKKEEQNFGTGSRLLAKIVEFARSKKMDFVELHALKDRALIKWYIKQGFRIEYPCVRNRKKRILFAPEDKNLIVMSMDLREKKTPVAGIPVAGIPVAGIPVAGIPVPMKRLQAHCRMFALPASGTKKQMFCRLIKHMQRLKREANLHCI